MKKDIKCSDFYIESDLILQNVSALQERFAHQCSELSELQLELAPQLQVDSAGLQFLLWLQIKISPSILNLTITSEHSLLQLMNCYDLSPQFKLCIKG